MRACARFANVQFVLVLLFACSLFTGAAAGALFESSEHEKAVIAALCKAKCMAEETVPHLDPHSLFLTNPSTCSSQRCLACQHANRCHSGVNDTTNTNAEFLFVDFVSPKPIFHCSQMQADKRTFNAAFRFEYTREDSLPGADKRISTAKSIWNSNHHTEMLLNLKSWAPELVPRVFVIRQELAGRVSYVVSEKWMHTVEIREKARLTLSVTAVSASAVYKQSPSTSIQLHNSTHRAGGKPRHLRVVATRLVNKSSAEYSDYDHFDFDYYGRPLVEDDILNRMDLELVVHWESGSGLDTTCTYALWLLHDYARKIEFKKPEHAFWAVLDKRMMGSSARFGGKLKIDVVEVLEPRGEDGWSSIIIVLPTCLDFLGGDFTKCAPPPVRNLRGHLQLDGFLTLGWDPPAYGHGPAAAKPNKNHVKFYRIDLHGVRLHSDCQFFPIQFFVPGNVTHFERYLNQSSSIGCWEASTEKGTEPLLDSFVLTAKVKATTIGGASNDTSVTVQVGVQSSASPSEPSFAKGLLTTLELFIAMNVIIINCKLQ